MQVRLLGPLEVAGDAGPVALASAKERTVLALLALHANQTVGEDRLIEALWGDDPPRTAEKTFRSHVSRLRQALARAGNDVAIDTTPGGYRLRVGPEGLDITRVEQLLAQAREATARGDHAWAAVALTDAARAWRGRPLGELADEPWAVPDAHRLAELRLVVLEERVDAELACGRHAALVAELEALCAEHPLRERFWAQRITALYRSGRQAEALRVYQTLRTTLADELGIDPSPELQALERAVLAQDPSLAWTSPPDAHTPSALPAHAVELPTGLVTFLLTDIAGSTALWEAHPKAMAAALLRHDELVAETVSAYGGRVIKSKGEGDSTLSVFVRATDAAGAAVALQRAIVGEEWPEGLDLCVRAALHTGEAEQRDGDYYGRPLNRAARLRAIAAGGQIICSRATADLVADALPEGAEVVELGRQELRDLARAEHVFALVHPELPAPPVVAAQQDAPAATDTDDTTPRRVPLPVEIESAAAVPFVGREGERARLRAALSAAAAGERQAVLVTGEPGIGKTRLASEAALDAFADGATVLYGRCDEDLGVAYQPFAEALRHWVEHGPAALLRAHVDRYGSDLVRLVPALARRVPGLPAPLELDPETERLRLFEAVAGLLAAASAAAPVVLVLDDLHWAAKPTLLLLRHLLAAPDPTRLLVVGTYRDTEVGRSHPLAETLADLRRATALERMALSGLDGDEVAALVSGSPGAQEAADPALADAIRERTAGNPFFVHEITRHLDEVGDAGLTEVGLPEGVRDVVGRRLSRLSDAANRVLAVASAAGSEFELAVLEHVESGATAVLDALDEAVTARLVDEVTGAPGAYRFSHSLIRETLYEELTTARRVRLHRQIGEAVEAVHARDLDAHLPALARHFAHAAPEGLASKAADYALRAARQALTRLAFEEAVSFAESGLTMTELDRDAADEHRFALLLVLADAQTRRAEYERAREAALEAAAVARTSGSPEQLCEAAIATGYAHPRGPRRTTDERVVALCHEALAAIDAGDTRLRARVLAALADEQSTVGWGVGERHVSRDAQEELARAAVEAARAAGDVDTLCAALTALTWPVLGSPRVDEEIAVCDELVEISRQHDLPVHEANGHYYRGQGRMVAGDFTGAREDFDALARLAESTRSVVFDAYALAGRSLLALLAGDFEGGERLAVQLLAHARHDSAFESAHFGLLSQLARERGRVPELLMSDRWAHEIGARFSSWMVIANDGRHDWRVGDNMGIGVAVFLGGGSVTTEQARAHLAEVAAHDWDFVPRGYPAWAAALAVSAEFAVVTGCADYDDDLAALLRPYSGLMAGASVGGCFGAIDRYLAMLAARAGRYDDAETLFASALALEERACAPPLAARTRYWHAWMLSLRDRAGDRDRARQLLDECRRTASELGMAKLEADAVALDAQLTRPPANLPMPTSSFVGRERDVADVRERLRSAHIVTLVGTGGVGKTRLALHVASESLLDFDDGAWLCELGNLTDPASIPEAMAIALGLTQAQGKPVEDSVVDHLRDKRLLLIVDNCEHLVGAVAELLEEIARACPEVRVLATSREALAVEGEVTWPVRSLDAPPADAAIGPDALAKYEAVQLFVDRARAVRPDFDVDATNAAAVSEVCRRLDGIPLAIELAAARVRSMSPAEIRDRLDERFRLLTGGRRTALERHQTLRAAVTWSYELLTDEEQRLFRRLSVFAGSFDLEAAEAVPAAGDLASADILDLLSNLVAKSLVTVDDATAGVTRYRVLETLRQYGRERLDEAGEVVEVAARHAAYYAGLVARIGRGLRGPDEAVWMDRVEAELDNLRAASRWAVDVGDARLAIGLCAPILIWSFFGMPVGIEIGSWARAAVDMPGASDVPNFGDACMWAGLGEWWLGTLDRTIHYSQLALRAAESRGDSPNPIAYALRGMNVYVGGTWEAALEAFTDGARAARSWPDEAMVAGFLGTMGMALSVSRESDAAAFADEAVMLARRVGCPSVLATALCGLGQVYLSRDANRAITAYEEALALDNGQRFWTTLQARINLALIRVRRGDRAALTAIASIVRDLYRVGNMGVLVGDLSTATGLLADLGEDEATARVAGVVESGALGQMMLYQPGDAERVAAARARLGDIEFEAQKAIGASWADDEAIEQVCALLEALAVGGSSRPD